MGNISEERYREIIRYIIALEEAEDFSHAVIELLRFILPFDAAMYIHLEKTGLLAGVFATAPGFEDGALFHDQTFCMKDPVFDFGNRATGMQRRETVCIDLLQPDRTGEAGFHDALRTAGVRDYISFAISENGEGIRIFRREDSPRFTEEDIAVCKELSPALKRMMPRHREYEKRRSENYLFSVTHKMLPFGMLLYDEQYHLLRYNTLGISRVSEITGEQNFREMIDSFTKTVKKQVEGMVHDHQEMCHQTIDNKYICEVILHGEMDDNEDYLSYIVVNLYGTAWFRDYLTDSVETVLKQYGLTARETEIASAVVQGLSNKEIAEKLYISNNTVKEHFKNIFRKMQVSSRGDMLLKIFINKEGETAKDD